MKINIRELLFFALLFCLPLATYLLVFKPREKAADSLRADIKAKHEISSDFSKYRVLAVNNLEEDLASLMSLKDKAVTRLPLSEDAGQVVDELSRIAQANKLKINKMQSLAVSDKEKLQISAANYGFQRFDVELEGNYMGFYAFLAEMEKQPRIIHIRNLDIQRIDENNRQGDIKVRMDLRVYYGKAVKVQAGTK